MEWQLIETAPKNFPILVWDDYYLMRIASWSILHGCWQTDAPCIENTPLKLSPVYWRPLPAPPSKV